MAPASRPHQDEAEVSLMQLGEVAGPGVEGRERGVLKKDQIELVSGRRRLIPQALSSDTYPRVVDVRFVLFSDKDS